MNVESNAKKTEESTNKRAGAANCGCWYHAEDGDPCEHDLAGDDNAED